jgi:nitrogenase molybdenum-iron protein beta chain
LSGALAAISALPGVVPIAHTALGCSGNLSGSFALGAGNFGSGYCGGGNLPTSGITETEIVFGGDDRLTEQIKNTLDLIDAELFVVATGCMTEMIGDDTAGVVSGFADEGKPVLAISTPSFRGDSYTGYEILLDGIFDRYLKPAPQEEKDPALVNIFGVIPAYDPFFRGDLEEIARLLRALGLSVNTFFTPDQTFDNLVSAPKAGLNIVLSRVWGTGLAARFQEKHGTPYLIADLPIGPEATDEFLLRVAEQAGITDKIVNDLIQKENEIYYGYFERGADVFVDSDFKFYSIVVSNSNYAIPLTRFAERELGWVGLDTYVTDQLQDAQKEILKDAYRAGAPRAELLFETDASRISKSIVKRRPENRGQRYFDSVSPLYILGSALEKKTAAERGAQQLSVSFPAFNRMIVDRGYAGYRGGLHLFEDIVGTLVFPKG